ncbi:glycosyltransferase family 2 protein [Haloplanus pelagicus]|uniref:glycosyltransferase family 2 protein n=1 Tax=Haloplanus pelagicus TaxID=2949995 RepID=UPI00204162CE|nr:glycosyltransferase [Haloplanus sp. HW8-1]
MASPGTVSVIIPTHYRNDPLRDAIRSALGQTYDPVEVIVVDDSGEEHARSVVDEYESVTYVPLSQSRGAQGARQAGVERATGEYIQFLDDDDQLLASKLSRQVPVLAVDDDDVGVVYCGLRWEDGPVVLPRPGVRGDVLVDALRFDTSSCMMGTMLIERSALDRVDLLKHDHAADDIGFKIELARVTDFDYINDVLLIRGDSAGSLSTTQAAVAGRFEIIDMYDDLYARFPEDVRREALAEAYLVAGEFALQDAVWSTSAIRSFVTAVSYSPGFSLPYAGSLVSSLFGRLVYKLSRRLYSRLVLGSKRKGKGM